MRISFGRRAVLTALAASVIAFAAPAAAQDPRMTEAKMATLDWLALADADDAAGSYAAASQRFRTTIDQNKWASSLKTARAQFGPATSRTFIGMQPLAQSKDAPPGEFIVVAFRTEFGKRLTGTESVTLERESDGHWRVVGYLMR